MSKEHPSVSIVISTYASVAYVALHLEIIKQLQMPVKVLISDDHSPHSDLLAYLAKQYNASFVSNVRRYGWLKGDASGFLNGLIWAHANQYDWVFKFSRRAIPTTNWLPDFYKAIEESHAHTISGQCKNLNWHFRTEFCGMRVNDWIALADDFKDILNAGNDPFMEGIVHKMSQKLPSEEFLKWPNKPQWANNYHPAVWWGENRVIKHPNIMLHWTHKPEDFFQKSQELGLPYTLNDFQKPDEHLKT